MDRVTAVQRLDGAASLSEFLDAGRDAFAVVLEVINAHHDRGGEFDAALVMAAAAAADGRDALLWAPSMPYTAGNHAANDLVRSAVAPADLRAVVSAIARRLEARLREAHALAAADGDRSACSDGADCARRVHDLTGGTAQ